MFASYTQGLTGEQKTLYVRDKTGQGCKILLECIAKGHRRFSSTFKLAGSLGC